MSVFIISQNQKGAIMAVLHTYIFKNGFKTKKLTGMSAIREKCLECQCWNNAEVARCPSTDCALYPFRSGHYPKNQNDGEKDIAG